MKNETGTLVPIGSFSSSDGHVTLWSGVSPDDFRTLTVTIESADNDQASSGRRVLLGTSARRYSGRSRCASLRSAPLPLLWQDGGVVGDGARRGMNRIVGSLVNPVVSAVDMDHVMEQVDVDAVLERVDLNEVLDRVDVNRLLDRVDVDGLLDRIDVDRLLSRLDVDKLISRVDVAHVVADAKIGNVVTDSATSIVDFGRSQLNGLDALTASVGRQRDPQARRTPRSERYGQGDHPHSGQRIHAPDRIHPRHQCGHRAFGLSVFLITYLVNLFFAADYEPTQNNGPWWAAAGGPAFRGLLLLGRSGSGRPHRRQGAFGSAGCRARRQDRSGRVTRWIRVLVFPFSFILGLGFLPIVFAHDRRALHDLAAKTIEVYDWGDRMVILPARFTRWFTPHAPVG